MRHVARRWSVGSVTTLGALGLALLLGGPSAAATSASAGSSIQISSQSAEPQPSGDASAYRIEFTCSSVLGSSCGSDPTITIPLDLTAGSGAPSMSTWAYSAASSPTGLIQSAGVVGGNYVIHLVPGAIVPGDSDSIDFDVTPPNNVTPDGTAWSLKPTFSSSEIGTVTAPTPATGSATATARIAVSKNTSDGGAVYVVGKQIVYTITARCNPARADGNLYLTAGSLVDTLPAQLTFLRAVPAPSSVNGQTLTWSYPDASGLPTGCAAGATGSTTYQVYATLNADTPNDTQVSNSATFSGTPLGETTPQATTGSKTITAVTIPPGIGPNFAAKSSLGPLDIPGLGFHGTYAGHWLPAIDPTPPVKTVGVAEGSYTVSVNYPASQGYATTVVDPVPCLTNPSGIVYRSSSVIPPTTASQSPTIQSLCTDPAFDPTAIRIDTAAPSLSTAIGDGWLPQAVLTNGTTVDLVLHGMAGAYAYFDVPHADVGKVAAIEVPRSDDIRNNSLTLYVFGYGDGSLASGSDLHDVVSATAYPENGIAPSTSTAYADLYIEPDNPQLGVYKAFGTPGAAAGGTTALGLSGTLALVAPPSGSIVLTDLLPTGLSWSNPSTTAAFTLTAQQGGSPTTVTGTVEDITDFDQTGRELIRVTFPASGFTSGFYTLTAPTDFVDVKAASAGTTYDNTAQMFIHGGGQTASDACGPGTGTSAATFESSDPLDLDGDGMVDEHYCQWEAVLTIPPSTGSSFSLVKTVQGNLDTAPKGPGGIGDASAGGTGVYDLAWSNTGSTTLTDPVVYDILPYVGDTGVSVGQSTVPRASQFATIFQGVTGGLPQYVSVAYSESTNPCRPEVYPNDAGCVDDWSTTPPSDLGLVTAVRFTADHDYTSGQGFSVSLQVGVPVGQVNTVAWNSAATSAEYEGVELPPAEPTRVGLTAPGPKATPTLSTQASATEVQPSTAITDTVTVGSTDGGSGKLHWTLYGPMTPASDGTCNGLTWSNAPTAATGTVPVAGDGSYVTQAFTPTQAGCYTYADSLTGKVFASTVTTSPGASGETVLVSPAQLSTVASASRILPGGSVTDAVTVSGTGVGSGTLDWTLVGPVAPGADGTCADVNWSNAATADSGTLSITGDGTYTTAASTPTQTGCYSYVQALTAGSVGGPATTQAGDVNETVLVAQPSLSTSISSASVPEGGTVDDLITVTGTGGSAGELTWALLGPVSPGSDGTCDDADWTSAATVDSGTLPVTADGTIATPTSSTLTSAGCYGYSVVLTGTAYGSAVISPAGAVGEVTLVPSPVNPGGTTTTTTTSTTPTTTTSTTTTPAPRTKSKTVDVTIVKRALQRQVALGGAVTYRLTVHNSGPGTATGVRIVDRPATAMGFVSAHPSAGRCGHGFPLICTIGTLRAGHTATVTVVARPLSLGTVTNTAHVTVHQTNSAPPRKVHSSVPVHVKALLRLSKTASVRQVVAGQELHYSLVVANPTSVTIHGARLCDDMPAGLVFVSATRHMTLVDGVRCLTIAALAPHREVTVIVTARALPGAAGELTNRATLGGRLIVPGTATAKVGVIRSSVRPGGVTG